MVSYGRADEVPRRLVVRQEIIRKIIRTYKNNPSRNDLRGVIFMRGFLLVVFMARILRFRDEFNAG